MSCVVIIPARGGSKGIPRKNLQRVGDRTLITRAVSTAIEADVGPVWVSTDSGEILAELVTEPKAQTVVARLRPPEFATDEASTESVLIDCLRAMPELPTHTILMQCTSPFTGVLEVQRVADMLRLGAECVITVTPFYGLLWNLDRNGVDCTPVPGIDGCAPRERRQDRDPPWLETGALYGCRTDLLLETGSRFCGKVKAIVMPKHRSPEIDDYWDLEMCRRMASYRGEGDA